MFKQQRAQALQWWYNLAERERLLVMLVAACVLFLLTVLLLKKSYDYKQAKQNTYQVTQMDYHWMLSKKPQLEAASQGGNTAQVRNLFKAVSSSLKEYQLDVKRVNPEGDNSIRLDFDDAKFDQFWLWLVNLQQQEGVYIKSINIDRQATQGLVDVRVSVTRGV